MTTSIDKAGRELRKVERAGWDRVDAAIDGPWGRAKARVLNSGIRALADRPELNRGEGLNPATARLAMLYAAAEGATRPDRARATDRAKMKVDAFAAAVVDAGVPIHEVADALGAPPRPLEVRTQHGTVGGRPNYDPRAITDQDLEGLPGVETLDGRRGPPPEASDDDARAAGTLPRTTL